ncbi:MAG: hypothetical protein RLZZ347_757 [Candidatus Parcubacteria bacterium]|jgi:hypothetical protein
MISQEAIQKILGIDEMVYLTPEEMADKLNITFFPRIGKNISKDAIDFSERLKKVFGELKVNIVPYEDSLEKVSWLNSLKRTVFLIQNNWNYVINKVSGRPSEIPRISVRTLPSLIRRKRLKRGISIVVLGDQPTGNLPMEYIYSFKDNSVINIVDFPKHINSTSDFESHFDTAMGMFSYHMANIILAVDDTKWMLYNFNASHPIYPIDNTIKEHVLKALIPKIVAPIRPHKFSEFIIKKEHFSLADLEHKETAEDLILGAKLFGQTKLYPTGKKIDLLPFRNNYYRWIGKMHLDNRNGMSFGFLARQMAVQIPKMTIIQGAQKESKDYFIKNGRIHLTIEIANQSMSFELPDVWVLSQRSGSDKVNINPEKDLLKIGLSHGKMMIQTPEGLELHEDYKPSFDTKVILAHAIGNVIVATISKYLNINKDFVNRLETVGLSLSHWHGYVNEKYIPEGWVAYGSNNPHVACSSPQSAIYALAGKLDSFKQTVTKEMVYNGDIHIEPHHGTNITFTSIHDLATLFLKNPDMTSLGNKYLVQK